jgi:hypothetical protein
MVYYYIQQQRTGNYNEADENYKDLCAELRKEQSWMPPLDRWLGRVMRWDESLARHILVLVPLSALTRSHLFIAWPGH